MDTKTWIALIVLALLLVTGVGAYVGQDYANSALSDLNISDYVTIDDSNQPIEIIDTATVEEKVSEVNATLVNTTNKTENDTLNLTNDTILNQLMNITNNTTINETLNTTNNTTTNETLNVTNNTTVNDTQNVTNNTTTNQTINTTNNTTINDTQNATNNTTVNETLNTTNNTTINETQNATNNTTVNETLNTTNNTTINDTQNATNNTTVNETLNITNNTTANDTLNVTNNTTVNETINETDESSVNNTTEDNQSIENKTYVNIKKASMETDDGVSLLNVEYDIPEDAEKLKCNIKAYGADNEVIASENVDVNSNSDKLNVSLLTKKEDDANITEIKNIQLEFYTTNPNNPEYVVVLKLKNTQKDDDSYSSVVESYESLTK